MNLIFEERRVPIRVIDVVGPGVSLPMECVDIDGVWTPVLSLLDFRSLDDFFQFKGGGWSYVPLGFEGPRKVERIELSFGPTAWEMRFCCLVALPTETRSGLNVEPFHLGFHEISRIR